MDRKIEETVALGGTQILMQGGAPSETVPAMVPGFAVAYKK